MFKRHQKVTRGRSIVASQLIENRHRRDDCRRSKDRTHQRLGYVAGDCEQDPAKSEHGAPATPSAPLPAGNGSRAKIDGRNIIGAARVKMTS